MEAGDWQAGVGFRHQYSYKHFVGPTEQTYRQQLGNEVENRINLEDLTVTYQITDRWSVQAMVPVLMASRRANNSYATFHTAGFGDISVAGQCWIWNPKTVTKGDIEIGLGLEMPTGKDDVKNNVIVNPGGAQQIEAPDYSIQPGQGSWAMLMEWQAFRQVYDNTILYTDGDYVMTQGGNNGVISAHGGPAVTLPAANAALTQYNAIQDQYLLEVGAAHPFPKIDGLSWTFALRDEGVPARNLIGNDLGFRRPGFALSAAPGFVYTRGVNMIQAEVGIAMFRDRTRSVPDKILGGHGDAAFADYVWLLSYTLRLPKKGVPEALNGTKAPEAKASTAAVLKPFKLKTLDGTPKTLQDYAGKATVVSFFFPQCPFCNVDLPLEQKMYDKYKDKGLSMVWINILPEQEKLIVPWLEEHHYNVPVLVGAPTSVLSKDYQIKATPTNYLVGANGEVLYYSTGYKPGDEKSLETKIEEALSIAP